MSIQETYTATKLLPVTARRVAILALKHCREYLRSPAHRREFEEWYFKKYGVKYQWKFSIDTQQK